MNLQQIGLKSLKIKDRLIIDSILNSKETMLSAYAFAAHYIWRDIFHFYWAIIDGYFCLFAQYGNYLYMPVPPVQCHGSLSETGRLKSPLPRGGPLLEVAPLSRVGKASPPRSSEAFHKIITTVFSIMEKINKNKAVSRIENIDGSQIEDFVSMGYTIQSGEGEYVYLRETLAHLRGNRYKSKRALCNYFEKHYCYNYEPFKAAYADECMHLFEEWRKKREEKIKDPFYHTLMEDSSYSHRVAIEHSNSLRLTGRVVRMKGHVEGYILGFARGDIFYILMEVVNPDIKGLAQFIFREFCRELEDYTWINTLGDSGLKNLQRVKLSYRPWKIIPSYIAYEPHSGSRTPGVDSGFISLL